MITIYNLNAGQADCILVHFEKGRKYFNLLVDGAYKKNNTEEMLNGILEEQEIQGMVMSHLDADHISGMIGLIEQKYPKIQSAFLLFNKFDASLVSYQQARTLAEKFEKNFPAGKLIKSYEDVFPMEWMEQFNRDDKLLPIRIYSLAQRQMKETIDPELINITIIGPTMDNVKKFMQNWSSQIGGAEIINRSSIMLLLEFDGKAVILSGDGYYTDIQEALGGIDDLKKIHVVKAAHHGAKKNNYGLSEFVLKYGVEQIFFTIDESKYDSKGEHPCRELLEELLETKVKMTCSTELQPVDASVDPAKKEGKLGNYMQQQIIIKAGE